MLNATRALVADDGSMPDVRRGALVNAISRRGSAEDADALLQVYVRDPLVWAGLVDPLFRLGGPEMARRLFDRFVTGGRLNHEHVWELLWGFGWSGLTDAREMLFDYACVSGAWESNSAVFGLLHLPLDGMEGRMRAALTACLDQSYFSELLPAFAGHLGDVELMDALIARADQGVASPTLQGLILGAGLLGERSEGRFERVLWDRSFHDCLGRGSVGALGMQAQGMTMADVCAALRTRLDDPDEEGLRIDFLLVEELAHETLSRLPARSELRFLPPLRETAQDLWAPLFESTGDGGRDLPVLARELLGGEGWFVWGQYQTLQARVAGRIAEDALVAESGAS